jgi:ABC-type uncharacterized transport system substrate-binding protein
MKTLISLVSLLAALPLVTTAQAESSPICLYVSSYHAGYHWNDGIETGLTQSLGKACELKRFYMDTLRNKAPEFAAAKGAEAKQLIDAIKPAVVIACDDPASKHLVMPYLKNTTTPVVFCGVNWTVEPYGYPHDYPHGNVTGMIEVAPIQPLIQEARSLLPKARQLAFLAADVPTQHKEVERLQKVAAAEGLTLSVKLVNSFAAWRKGFEQVQNTDLILLGNPAGIHDWDDAAAGRFLQANTGKTSSQASRGLTLSFGVAMSRHAVFAMINMPEEQGEWSGQLARLILAGKSPAELPITANRRWQMLANPELARKIGIRLPERILQRAVIVDTRTDSTPPGR